MIKFIICRLFHRPYWRMVTRHISGPALGMERHIGKYVCKKCGIDHTLVGPKIIKQDSYLPIGAGIPDRGFAMKVHRLLGGE